MTKQTRTLAVLAAALIVCGGAYGGLRLWNDKQAELDTSDYITQLSDCTELSFTNGEGEFTFIKEDGAWSWAEDAAFPADQDQLDSLAEGAGKLAATRTISAPEGLSSYGLDSPSLQITVTGEDGQSAQLLIGSASDSFYYAKRADSDTVYTIDTSLPDTISGLELLDLAEIAQIPALGTDNVDVLTWESGDTALTLTRTEGTAGTETEADVSSDASASSSDTTEEEPADVWDVNGAEIPADNSAFSSLMAQVGALVFDACYDYKGETATLEDCGLNTPVGVLTAQYGADQTMTLTIGALDQTGEAYYAQLEGEPAVYTLSTDSVSTLIALNAEELTQTAE